MRSEGRGQSGDVLAIQQDRGINSLTLNMCLETSEEKAENLRDQGSRTQGHEEKYTNGFNLKTDQISRINNQMRITADRAVVTRAGD